MRSLGGGFITDTELSQPVHGYFEINIWFLLQVFASISNIGGASGYFRPFHTDITTMTNLT